MHWSTEYIGLPWKAGGRTRDGLDCYGLAHLVYRERLGIELPSYDDAYVTAEEWIEIDALIAGGLAHGQWKEITLKDAHEYDGLIFRRGALATHVGIVVAPGLMLHATAGRASAVERFANGQWKPALSAVLRYEARS